MITTTMIENSVISLLIAKYPNSHIFRRNATQTKDDAEVFVVQVELNGTMEFKDFQRKDLDIIIQYFKTDRIKFNENLNDVRDALVSEIFINSIPIIDINKNVVKYLLIKASTMVLLDDILSLKITTDFVDDVVVNNFVPDLMGTLNLKGC